MNDIYSIKLTKELGKKYSYRTLNYMVKYKVNLKFKENEKSLNEIIINALKIELEKRINTTYDNLENRLSFNNALYFKSEGNSN